MLTGNMTMCFFLGKRPLGLICPIGPISGLIDA